MIVLYINNEHCTSLDQLKGYFSEDTTPGSDVYDDLIDYGRHGEIAAWLRQEGEPELSSKMESIPTSLSDSSFYVHMKAVITGVKDTGPIKPSFDRCFQFEDLICDLKETEANVSVRLKVLMSVNEDYELSVSSNWGTRGMIVNPYSHPEGKLASFDFTLRKRPSKDIGEIIVMADGEVLLRKKNRKNVDEYTVGDTNFKMIRVEGGTFMMGTTSGQRSDAYDVGKPVHRVTLSSYYIGETEVTQAMWAALMCSNPSYFKGDTRPVECVSWGDCQEFIRILNKKTGKFFRLPTEAEWEFAARGGTKSKGYIYSGSNDVDRVAWYVGNALNETHPVKEKMPNELGIYDMSGNVWERCQDRSSNYPSCSQTSLIVPVNDSHHVSRGGSFGCEADHCTCLYRNKRIKPDKKFKFLGFRLALSE